MTNRYTHGEANWGSPRRTEAKKGSHLTLEIPLRWKGRLVALLLRKGVHGGDARKLYFPHDLMRVGETVETAVARIVRAACGAKVTALHHLRLESWADDDGHWHVCHNVAATISDLPSTGGNVRAVVAFSRDSIPAQPFAWWSKDDLLWLQDEVDHLAAPRARTAQPTKKAAAVAAAVAATVAATVAVRARRKPGTKWAGKATATVRKRRPK